MLQDKQLHVCGPGLSSPDKSICFPTTIDVIDVMKQINQKPLANFLVKKVRVWLCKFWTV